MNREMKILFLGTGEAFSERANTSILIDERVLLDCGLTTLQQLMRIKFKLKRIEVIFISHLHADHYFSLPSFLVTCYEESRKNTLNIIGPIEIEEYIRNLLYLAYRKNFDDLNFKINIKNVRNSYRFEDYRFSFAPMEHSVPCLAVSIKRDGRVTYTGDGIPTKEVIKIAKNSDLLIAEAYKENIEGHSSIMKSVKFAKESNSKRLALVHISRKEIIDKGIKEAKNIFPNIFIPNDLDFIEI
ncbi:MAG: hypothetical protein DRO92_01960 [Candidatus Altiarchaeales archaeon]|nr:MAG: hypothetical protein DRO92_01960 [Candidatus Altiarchaeales archaeon]